MKKKILYALLLLLIGLILAYAIRYKTSLCLCQTIPKDADAVVLVKVRNLERHILHDVVTHPMSYFGSDDKIEKDSLLESEPEGEDDGIAISLTDCISIPKALVFYRSSDQWFSSKIKIKDKSKLEKYLTYRDFSKIAQGKSVTYSSGQRHVFINDGTVQLSYGPVGIKIEELAYEENDFLKKGDVLFDALTHSMSGSTSDAIYVDSKDQNLDFSFNSGSINIDGNYHIAALQPSTTVVQSSGIGALSAAFDIAELKALLSADQIEKFTNFTKLQIDSLQQHWDGSINAALQGFSMSSDTIKTYEYDDDFNKVEVQKVEQVLAPNYMIQLGMSLEGVAYMKRKNAIVEEDGMNVLAIMPLAKTFATSSDNKLNLFTNEQELSLGTSDDKLLGFMDVQKFISSAEDGAMLLPGQLSSINDIRFSISNDDEVKVEVTFKSRRNSLAALIFNE